MVVSVKQQRLQFRASRLPRSKYRNVLPIALYMVDFTTSTTVSLEKKLPFWRLLTQEMKCYDEIEFVHDADEQFACRCPVTQSFFAGRV